MRRTILMILTLATLNLMAAPAARAQETSYDPVQFVPRVDASLGYEFLRANAPPGVPTKFDPNGGYASVGLKLKYWLSIAGEFTGTHSTDISALHQDLTLTTFTAGPRITFRRRRTVLFGETTYGFAHGGDSYFPTGTGFTTSANSFALTGGGGVDVEFTHSLAIRAVQAQYLHTGFNNGVNTSQNQLLLGAGVVLKFRGRYAMPHAPAIHEEPKHVSLNCSANVRSVNPGQTVEISALANVPDGEDVSFSWSSTGGSVAPTNSTASIDTAGLAPGMYTVTGRASLSADASVGSTCEVPFRVLEPPTIAPPIVIGVPGPPSVSPSMKEENEAFHTNVQDAYFDYDKWAIRPDTQEAIDNAATYLKAHPQINVLVGGYADERGTPEYDIALGEKRANATRDALIADGVDPGRVTVVSYGKGVQVCTSSSEPCYQRNRRAAFVLRPY